MARRKSYKSDYNTDKGMYSKSEYERKNSQAGRNGGYSKAEFSQRYNSGIYDQYRQQLAMEEEQQRAAHNAASAVFRLEEQRQKALQQQERTAAWKNMSQQATYSPAGDQRGQAYAEKMKYDTMGRDAYLQDLENQRRNQQTYMTQRQPVEELQAEKRYLRWLDGQMKQQQEQERYAQAQFNASHEGTRAIKEETGGSATGAPWTINMHMAKAAKLQADRESDALDKGNDPWNVSDKGLPDWTKRNQKAAEEYSITPGQLWADAHSYAEDVQMRQRTAGFNEEDREENDRLLYDSINGKNAYNRRLEAIETDADVDALETEMAELWAQYERGELPAYIREIHDRDLYDSVYGKGAYDKRMESIKGYGVPKKINEGSEALNRDLDELWGRYDRGELTEYLKGDWEQHRDAGDRYFDFGTDYNDWASMTPEKRRETLWMEMMGTDYAAALEGMTDTQKAEMNRRMDLIMDKAMQGKTKDFNAAADAYSNLVTQGEAVQEYRNKIKVLDIQAEGLEAQGYTGESVPAMLEANKPRYVSDPEDTEGMLRWDRTWSNTEKAMYQMNYRKNLDGTGDLYSDTSKYMLASPEQVKQANIFYEYDQKNGTHMTESFLEGIDSYLTSELAKYQEEYARSLADDPFRGSVARVASYAAKPITGLLGTAGTILNTLGVEGAQDTTGDFFKYDKLINVLREQGNTNAADWTAKTFGEEWRDRTTFALGVVDSIADNIFAMAVGSKMAGVSAATRTEQNVEKSMRLVQLIMSAEATSATMIEKLDSGMDGTEAAVYSAGSGIIEWLTERYSLEQILKPDVKAMLGKPKQLISFLVKSSAAEGSEEIASDLLNLGLDSVVSYIAGHENEIRQRVNEYITNEGMTASEAEKRVLKEKLGEIAQSGLAGALSGLGMAGGRTIANKFNQVQAGRNVRNENGGLQKIIDLAKGMEEGTESRALAEKLAGQKKVSNGELGRLSQLIITESSEERGEVIRGTVYRNVAEDLKAAGVENASQAAEVITRNLTEGNEKLSRADMKVLAQSEGAINVWTDYNTKGSLSTEKTNLDITSRTKNLNSVMEQVEDLTSTVRTARGKLAEEINRSVRETKTAAEAIDNFQQRRGGLMSESYAQLAKDLLESDKSTQKSKNYLDDVMRIRMAGMTLAKEMPRTGLEDATARALFNAAREEFNEADKGRLRNQVQVIPGKGVATIEGEQYGTDAWDDKLNELKVTRDQRQQLKALAEITVRMGNRLDVYSEPDRTGVYGFEDDTGTVHINLAGMNRNGMGHHMLVTMSHELTHWLEQNSWEGYNQLRSFVLGSLRSKGVSIEDKIINAIDSQNTALGAESGHDLDIAGAMKEIVAQSCENLLSSKALEAELRKTNPELHGKIRNFMRKFIARLRAAVQGMTGSLHSNARTLYNETEKIAELWLGARQEALSREVTGELETEENVNFSVEAEQYQFDPQFESLLRLYIKDHNQFKNLVGDSEIVIGETFKILQMIGIKNKPLVLDQEHLEKGFGKDAKPNHKVTVSSLMEIIRKANDPVAIIKSRAAGREDDSVVIIVDHKLAGDIVMVPIRVSTAGLVNKMRIDVNVMASAHSRSNMYNLLKDAVETELAGKKPGIYYANKNKADFLRSEGVQFPSSAKNNGLIHKITDNPDFVNQKEKRGKDTVKVMNKLKNGIGASFSVEQLDSEYDQAIRDGDKARQQEMMNQEEGSKKGSLSAAADLHDPASTSETTVESTSEDIISQEDDEVKRKKEERMDREYLQAIKDGDKKKQMQMIREKFNNTEGIYPFYAAHNKHVGEAARIARAIKDGDMEAIRKAASEMAEYVPDDAVLIPMPGHEGKVTNSTDTMLLAQELSRITGAPVFNVLEGESRGSRHQAKLKRKTGVKADQMGMRQNGELPADSIPIIIDNVVAVGETAKAAIQAIKGSTVLSYTKGATENVVRGLKAAYATKDENGNYIPLSKKGDINNPNWRYSTAEMSEPLQAAMDEYRAARDELDTLRKKYQELNGSQEHMDMMRRIRDAEKNSAEEQDAIEAYATWQNESGLADTYNKMKAAEERFKNANAEYDRIYNEEQTAAERKAIGESGLTEEEWRRKQAVKEFGYTTDFREAGYMLPNGKLLNFTGEKGKHYGSRGQDHRAIGTIYAGDQYTGSMAMLKFMAEGNIRVMAETPGIDINAKTEPTADQYPAIRSMARRFAGEEYFNVDFTDERGNTVDSIEYDGRVNAERIVNDIKTFYKTGEAPQPSITSQFHFSTMESPDMEVNNFMMGLQEFNMSSAQEKTMLRQYKDLHMSMGITQMKIRDYEAQLRKLRAKDKLSVYDRDQIRILNNRLDVNRDRMNRLRQELVRATKDKGYARQMMKNDALMKNLVSGVTADQLISIVQDMSRQLEELNKDMQARAEKLQELGQSSAVLQIRQQFNRQGLKRIAAQLKADMNSELSNKDIENRLAMIALKMKEGKFDQETTQELTDMILGKMRGGFDTYVLSSLRGEKIALSPAQLKELKATNSSLRELNAELAGTGIRFVEKGGTNLEQKWAEYCGMFTSLDENTRNLDQVDALMNLIRSERNTVFEERFNNENVQGTTEAVLKAAAELVPEIVTDAKSMNLIRETLQFVQEISGQAGENAEAISDIGKAVARIRQTGEAAASGANKLTGDIQTALSYFNDLSEQSEAAMWKRERLALIDQLKSENTQNLLAEQEKWRQKIEKDKAAREKMQSNMQLRKRIDTNTNRIRKLLVNETDLRNIPEHMKGLAREMLGLIVDNDLTGRKITGMDQKDLMDTRRVLDAMKELDGEFTPDDLRLINDEEAQAAVLDALADIEDGIGFYNNKLGKDMMANLQGFHNALERISDGVSTITSVISAERSLSFLDRRMDLADAAEMIQKDMGKSRFKGELAGRGAKAVNAARSAVFYGNMTPVYYFKMLRNSGMDMVWEDTQRGENRSGLETQKARTFLQNLAEKTGYRNWADEKHDILLGGQKTTVSIENMMELYAIWKREQTTNPEMSQHLSKGGVYIQDEAEDNGLLRREQKTQRAIRVTDEEIQAMYGQMTDAQKEYLDSIVKYLSNDMSDLGNEASMRMYGIKKYKETWYFPMKVWDGVKSARSDKGITGTDENRAAHRSWSKRRQHMAQNALVIGSFTKDAVNHIVEMINYNTMAPSIENINKILNFQITEGETEEDMTKRNMRIMFQEAYGREALKYLETFMKDMNGGVAQDQRKTLRDKTLTIFKKNAVAGSLSVALQQPLSYIRAAMLINPKYLAAGLSPAYWKGSYREMMEHSGVAVIKNMGRFDMNFGQSAKDYITPETKTNLYDKVSDALTVAPEMMDRMTWTRMWSAVKAEQAALHPEMDVKSDQFLDMAGRRFNQVMRETQVYDSILVKSSNMRSQNFGMKLITSFMAEPTLSLNVLADAVGRVKAGDKGAVLHMAKAAATFLLSAVMQAAVKGAMGSGRTPDDKKTWLENFLNKMQYNLMNEANPISLIPGYSDLIEVLKTGELKDDAMGAIGKLFSIVQTMQKAAQGNGKGWYRDIEDTAGQLAQLFTNIPAKNLMRDGRAIYNWISGSTYAARPTSKNILKYQAEANLYTADNLLGTLNAWLGEAGFKTSNKAYYSRMYEAEKKGDTETLNGIREYLQLGKGVKEETIQSGLRGMAKKDDSLDAEARIRIVTENSTASGSSDYVISQLKEGQITDTQARKMIKELFPEKSEDDIYWQVDRAKYQAETGKEKVSGNYYRLVDAVNENKAAEIQKAVKDLLDHGISREKIKGKLSDWKSEYLEADSRQRIRIRDALEKAYKTLGYTVADADKVIDGWLKDTKKTTEKKDGGKKQTNQDTTGQWGRGNINLNKRQVVHNSDGSISTERSFSVNIDGKEVLLPTVIDGKIVSEEEAIRYYEKTGKHLGKFNTVKEAEEYAEKLHERQEWYYSNK